MSEREYILENEIEKLQHAKKCLRGQLIAQGKEIRTLRRERDRWKGSANHSQRRWTEANDQLLEVYDFLYDIAADTRWYLRSRGRKIR